MMPGVGFAEMVILVVVAIVVIGPKDLPLMMRKFGRFTGKMRALAFEFKQGIDELGRQAELEELRKEVESLKKHTGLEDFQREMDQDRINLERDVASALTPAQTPAASGTTPPAVADDRAAIPDASEDFRIHGSPPAPPPVPEAPAAQAVTSSEEAAPVPLPVVKQETPA